MAREAPRLPEHWEEELRESSAFRQQFIREIFDCYYPDLISFAIGRGLDFHSAEEIAAEPFSELAAGELPQAGGDIERVRSWLYMRCNNRIVDWFRRAKAKKRGGLARRVDEAEAGQVQTELPGPSARALQYETWQRIRSALVALADEKQEHADVLLMRYFDGLPFRSIGEVMGISEDAAMSLCRRAAVALGKILGDSESILADLRATD